MRCSLCLALNPPRAPKCTSCGAILIEELHREWNSVGFLLSEIDRWEAEKRIPAEIAGGLKEEYGIRRSGLKARLKPAPPPPVPRTISPVPLRAEPLRAVTTVRPRPSPPPPPPPPKPPFSWQNLYTERNIRWVLNLGIFIFSVALAVFIHTQWKEMAPPVKVGILFGASFAAIGAGHLLRKTMLKATGTALVLLGAIAIPIDCGALLQFGIVNSRYADGVGLLGSLLSMAVYIGLARLYREGRFVRLSTAAAASLGVFLLRLAGVGWNQAACWTAPLTLAGILWGNRDVARTSWGLLGGCLALTGGLFVAGRLSPGPAAGALALEVALGSGLLAVLIADARARRFAVQWGVVLFLAAMYGVVALHSHRTFDESWLSLSLLGAAFGCGWIKENRAFCTAGVIATILSLKAAGHDHASLAWALAIPAVFHLGYGLFKNDERHSLAGGIAGAAALLVGLHPLGIPRLAQPLAYAFYGVAMVALSRWRTPRPFQVLGTLGAGAAMLLLALWYPLYYLPKPTPNSLAPPGGQDCQILGAAVALVAALAFAPLANAQKSRFLSDITYGCLGFSYILALRWAHVPGKWLGLSVALFGLACVLLQKWISRWLLRPTFFTGIACTIAATVFAGLQWLVYREYPQAALTLLLVGGFYLAAAARTPHKALYHPGVYLAVAGLWVSFEWWRIPPEARALLLLIPAAILLVEAARRRIVPLAVAALVVCLSALAPMFLDPGMYSKAHLPYLMAASGIGAIVSFWFAFARSAPREVDNRFMSGLMAAFGSAAYLLWLKSMATGSPWGGLVVLQMSVVLGIAAELLRRRGFVRQAPSLLLVSLPTTAIGLLTCHRYGFDQGVHLWGYALATVLYLLLGASFRRPVWSWIGAAAGAATLLYSLLHFEHVRWIGVLAFLVGALALQRRHLPLRTVGILALVVCPAHAAVHLYGDPRIGLVFLAMAISLACTRLHPFSLWPMLLGLVLSLDDLGWAMGVAFAGFALYLTLSLLRKRPAYVVVSLVLALLGDAFLAIDVPAHMGLAAYPLALVLFALGRDVSKRFGDPFGRPLLVAGVVAVAGATVLGIPLADDRIIVLLADTVFFGLAAVLYRRPALMSPCSAALVALDLALMFRFRLRPPQIALQLVSLALVTVIFVRAMGRRLKSYLEPVTVAALLVAAGAVLFGVTEYRNFTDRSGDIGIAIWGLMMIALTFGIAGRIRKEAAFLYLAAAHLLGAYYLALHKYDVSLIEAYTLPIAGGLGIWAALALRGKAARVGAEGLALGVLFLPSAIQSFEPDGGALHSLYALLLAFLAVVAGMTMKRRVYLFGGTGAFVLEVAGKALQFLIDQKLSVAGWGMILGGLMILLAALFESRKARIVREKFEQVRASARKYLAGWE